VKPFALLPLVGLLGAPAGLQEPPDPGDTLNQLLSGFGGFADVTGDELEKEVGEVGGIPFRQEVPLDYMTKDGLTQYVSELLDSEYPPPKADADERTLVGFDLLDPSIHLRELRKRLLLENIAGFYDERPGKKRLYAVSAERKLTPANQIILSHELRHAIQDQYANVHDLLPDSVGDFDDRRVALLSVLEGDATLVMEKFAMRRMGIAEGMDLSGMALPASALPGAPPILADQLVLPYVRGLDFIKAVYAQGGWDAVRNAWSRPPESTDEILHPERFIAHKKPRAVTTNYTPRGGREVNDGVLGEMFIMTLLGTEEASPPEGWAGDHFKVFDVGGRTLLVWRSVWETPAEDLAFRSSLENRFEASHGSPVKRGDFSVFQKGNWSVAIGERHGVLFIASDHPTALQDAIRDVP
jgi:hypothetical protein